VPPTQWHQVSQCHPRVSSTDQNTARQLDGVKLDKVFEDKASGKSTDRPELQHCLQYLRGGDVLHVHSIDRLARNLVDLQRIVDDLTSRDEVGVTVIFHKENLEFSRSGASPMQTLMFQLLGAFAQFERSLILERQREGIAKAKAAGRYLGKRSRFKAADIDMMRELKANGMSVSYIARRYGIVRQTVYKLLARQKCNNLKTDAGGANEHDA